MIKLIQNFVVCACAASCVGLTQAAQDNAATYVIVPPSVQTEVLFWDQMTAEQRARLWPLLTHEQRLFQWRYMTKPERRQMRLHMTPTERQAIKQRYVIDSLPEDQRENRVVRRMTPAEKELLRQQVIQVHIEIRRGVPYNCTDPTDCPKSAFRSRAAERSDPYLNADSAR